MGYSDLWNRGGIVLPLQGVSGAALVAFDVEEAAVGFEEGGEAGTGEADFLEDHCRGYLLTAGEDLGELGLDLFIGDLGETSTGALAGRRRFGGFGGLGSL